MTDIGIAIKNNGNQYFKLLYHLIFYYDFKLLICFVHVKENSFHEIILACGAWCRPPILEQLLSTGLVKERQFFKLIAA